MGLEKAYVEEKDVFIIIDNTTERVYPWQFENRDTADLFLELYERVGRNIDFMKDINYAPLKVMIEIWNKHNLGECPFEEEIYFQCPLCKKRYSKEEDADECLDDCKTDYIVGEVDHEDDTGKITLWHFCPICNETYEFHDDAYNCMIECKEDLTIESVRGK